MVPLSTPSSRLHAKCETVYSIQPWMSLYLHLAILRATNKFILCSIFTRQTVNGKDVNYSQHLEKCLMTKRSLDGAPLGT